MAKFSSHCCAACASVSPLPLVGAELVGVLVIGLASVPISSISVVGGVIIGALPGHAYLTPYSPYWDVNVLPVGKDGSFCCVVEYGKRVWVQAVLELSLDVCGDVVVAGVDGVVV